MKRFILVSLLGLLFLASVSFGGTKTLTATWQQTLPSPNDLAGWHLYSADVAGGPYTLIETIPFVTAQTTYTATKVFTSPDGQRKTWYFVLDAFDTGGNKSTYSNEASVTIDFQAPGVPITLTITVSTP